VRRLIFAISLWIILPGMSFAGPVDIEIRDRMGFAPKFIRVQVVVEKDEANRELCVIGTIGEDINPYVECFLLDAERAKRRHTVEFKRVDAGKYEFYAKVRRSLDDIYSGRVPVHVLAPGESIGE
jgi:hypothetical protein